MKMIVVVALALVATVAAVPVAPVGPAELEQILRANFDPQPDGSYQEGFETSGGIVAEEKGELKQVVDEDNKPQIVLTKSGFFQYTSPEGQNVKTTYFADETGAHFEGDTIPKAAARR